MTQVAAIVLCAGKGTRFHSEKSKMLHALCARPLCFWPIKAVQPLAERTIAVLGHQSDTVHKALREWFKEPLEIAEQPNPIGTADAVQKGLQVVGDFEGTIMVLCGDTPLLQTQTLKELLLLKEQALAQVAFLSARAPNPFGYGRVVRDDSGRVLRIVEERLANEAEKQINEVNGGVYVFDAAWLKAQLGQITKDNAQGEMLLPDLIAMAQNAVCLPVGYDEIHGVNDQVQLSDAEALMRLQIVRRWQRQGVCVMDPRSTFIDVETVLDADVTLKAQVELRGRCRVGKGSVIDVGSILTDAVVGEHVMIAPYSVIERAEIGNQAQIGPFARIRPETHIGEQCKVGNFVELKKSTLLPGAKVNHLSYVGDASVGEKANIGAGTITCNYDGYAKYRTEIGAGVFVGSNTTLVAPIELLEGSFVAAGSTLTKSVPKDALALSRTPQENKLGYAVKMRERLKARANPK